MARQEKDDGIRGGRRRRRRRRETKRRRVPGGRERERWDAIDKGRGRLRLDDERAARQLETECENTGILIRSGNNEKGEGR